MGDFSKYSDRELAGMLLARDQLAYAEIYDRYWGVLYRFARRILQNEQEAEDIVQDIFVMLWQKAATLEVEISLSAFLYASTRNRILKHFEKSKVRSKYIDSLQRFIDQDSYETDFLVRTKELAERIERELALLPPKMREVFELSRKSELSYRQIGEQLDITEETVKKQVGNARKILKAKFGSLFSVVMGLLSLYIV